MASINQANTTAAVHQDDLFIPVSFASVTGMRSEHTTTD